MRAVFQFPASITAVVDAPRGHAVLLPMRQQEIVDWLHPNGWSNQRRDWERLPAALEALGSLRVTLGNYRVALVHALAVPRVWNPGAAVVLQVWIPAGAAAGARLDWDRLRRYGANSAGLYRAYLSVSAALDNSAHNGQPITLDIGVPLTRSDGKARSIVSGSTIGTYRRIDVICSPVSSGS